MVRSLFILGLGAVLPCAFADPPDYDGVKQRMQKAVDEGMMTQAEADEVLQAMQKRWARREAKVAAQRQAIRQAEEAGELTPEQAQAKIDSIELDEADGDSPTEAVTPGRPSIEVAE